MEIVWSPPHSQEATAIGNFRYLPEYELIVCREHAYAVRNLDRHLLDYHVYSRNVRKAVSQRFDGLPRAAPEKASLPKAYGPPIEGRSPPRKGFACDEANCGWISTRRAKIAEHCKAHGWKSRPGDREHWADVWVQSFCLTPGKQRWFVIRVEEGETTADAAPMPEDVLAQKKEILRDFGAQRAERKAHLEVMDAEIAKTDQTGWWKRTDWVTHLGNSNLKHLAHAARLPGRDEPGLKKIGDAVDQMIEDCVKGLASLPQEIRRWLKSAKMEEVDPRPMGRLQNQDSQDRYANYWKRLICYSLRVVKSEQQRQVGDPSRAENETDSGSEEEEEEEEEEDQHAEDHDSIDEEDEEEHDTIEEDNGDTSNPIVLRDKLKDARRLFPWRDGQKEQARQLL